MTVGNFNGELNKVSNESSEIKSQFATILAALSGGSRKRTRVIEEADDTSDSDNDTPVKPLSCKRPKPMANSTTVSKGNKFTIGISFYRTRIWKQEKLTTRRRQCMQKPILIPQRRREIRSGNYLSGSCISLAKNRTNWGSKMGSCKMQQKVLKRNVQIK